MGLSQRRFKFTDMIESILICSLFVYGVKAVIDGYAWFFDIDLEHVYRFTDWKEANEHGRILNLRHKWQQFFMKPTFYCNVCMSSVWGSVYYWSMHSFELLERLDTWYFLWPLHLICSAAIITLINKIPE